MRVQIRTRVQSLKMHEFLFAYTALLVPHRPPYLPAGSDRRASPPPCAQTEEEVRSEGVAEKLVPHKVRSSAGQSLCSVRDPLCCTRVSLAACLSRLAEK